MHNNPLVSLPDFISSGSQYKDRRFWLSRKCASDCCLTPNEQMFSYIMTRTSYIQWNDTDVRFVLDQQC
jgi:hypothetical protein